jgi:hypothetical protein
MKQPKLIFAPQFNVKRNDLAFSNEFSIFKSCNESYDCVQKLKADGSHLIAKFLMSNKQSSL